MVDPKIKEEIDGSTVTLNRGPNRDSLDAFLEIAHQCLAEVQAGRPTMEIVIKELEKALYYRLAGGTTEKALGTSFNAQFLASNCSSSATTHDVPHLMLVLEIRVQILKYVAFTMNETAVFGGPTKESNRTSSTVHNPSMSSSSRFLLLCYAFTSFPVSPFKPPKSSADEIVSIQLLSPISPSQWKKKRERTEQEENTTE